MEVQFILFVIAAVGFVEFGVALTLSSMILSHFIFVPQNKFGWEPRHCTRGHSEPLGVN